MTYVNINKCYAFTKIPLVMLFKINNTYMKHNHKWESYDFILFFIKLRVKICIHLRIIRYYFWLIFCKKKNNNFITSRNYWEGFVKNMTQLPINSCFFLCNHHHLIINDKETRKSLSCNWNMMWHKNIVNKDD